MTATTELPQHLRALQRANDVKLRRAALKRRIAAGEASVSEVLEAVPPEAETMRIAELLRSQRRWGQTRARRLLAFYGIGELRELRRLTERQRRVLAEALAAQSGRYRR